MTALPWMPAPGQEVSRLHGGVAMAIVTANRDPEKLGRVKVKYPWLSDEFESDWARVASPGAGASRGQLVIPDIDDEVLVAFEHGLIDRPYVVGGLWNGKDKPPPLPDKPADVRGFTTRSGHQVRLDDTQGAEKIEITAAKAKSTIVFDTAKGTITIKTDADLVLEATNGAVKITGGTVEIKATKGAVKVEGIDVETKAQASLKQSAATAEVKANGPLVLKGAVVNIN